MTSLWLPPPASRGCDRRYGSLFGVASHYAPTPALVLFLFALHGYGQIPAPPGQLVEAEGRRVHINCTGTGSPSVILESGFPGSSLDWSLMQPMVAQFSRVCSYDRAGFGWSDQGKMPRSAAQIAEDLRAMLSAVNAHSRASSPIQ